MTFIQAPMFSIRHCSPFIAIMLLMIFDIRLLLSSRIFYPSCAPSQHEITILKYKAFYSWVVRKFAVEVDGLVQILAV